MGMENKCPDETLHMHGMNLNLCILSMLKDTFWLGVILLLSVVKWIHMFNFLCSLMGRLGRISETDVPYFVETSLIC